jgi:hypothetical protein
MPFRCPDDVEKWCEIHHTSGHNLEECKTFLYRKKMPPPVAQVAQEPRWGEHRWANPPDDNELMGEINVIFSDSISITSKTQGKKLDREISLALRIEPGRIMRWSGMDISFKPNNHPEIELSNRNLPFMVKLSIGRHKVAKLLIDNGASLNLIMRKTFIEMALNLKDLTPIYDTFHGVILGQSSTLIRRIDLEVLTFEVASFNIRYNCILGRPFLLKFMAVICTAYATLKMPDLNDVITIKADQRDALTCENVTLMHAGRFGKNAA